MGNSEPSVTPDPRAKASSTKKIFLCFDEPTDWDARVRWLRLSGWCVASSGEPLTAIRARLRGKSFPGFFDRDRPDVADHLAMPTAPLRCGFTVELRVPPGKSDLELQVAGADGRWRKAFKRTIYGPWFSNGTERERWREIDLANASARFDFWLDRPTDWDKPVSTLYISGWCVDRSGAWIKGIRGRIGSRTFQGNFGMVRRDIATIHPNLAPALHSGFGVAVRPPVGKSIVLLEVKDANGLWRAFFSHEVYGSTNRDSGAIAPGEAMYFLANAQPPGFELWIDRPADWDKLDRDLRISGWCVATGGESIAEMRARIGRKAFPVTYGLHRLDIALNFEGCPNALASGFSGEMETPHGWATFVLEGRTEHGWRKLFSRRIKGPIFSRLGDAPLEAVGDYARWIRTYDTLTRSDRQKISRQIAQFERRPLFSILLPVHKTPPEWLRRAVDSVRNQLYHDWELCIVDDASGDSSLWKFLQNCGQRDARIKVVRRSEHGHICAASNDALVMATGEFVALLDHDDELAPTALYFAALELNRRPDLQLLYSDEDKLDRRGRRCQPHFKSDWNPDLLTAQNYISHLAIYRTALAREVGGFRTGFEGAQDHDLALRCTEKIDADQIAHLPRVLYHWRTSEQSTAAGLIAKPYALDAAARAVREHFARNGVAATVERHREIYLRVRYPAPDEAPLVSMVIPIRDRVELLRQLVAGIFAKTEYPNYELVIIDNESCEKATLDFLNELKRDPRVLVHRVPGPFNYSQLNNIGVEQARGSVISLMNNDLEVINRDWLTEMLSHAIRPDVGVVGARLWYPNGVLQHGGVILGFDGVASHIHGGTREDDGYFSRQHLTQNLSAVTSACMLIRKDVYLEVNGFDEANLAVAFSDVDFCLRLGRAGYRIVWTPHAEFVHHESASRGIENTSAKQRRFLAEEQYMREKWRDLLPADPFYNPNLALDNKLFTLAFPPRLEKPWEADRPGR